MIIIIAGLPGSGKSYLAGQLSDKLTIPVISGDRIKKRLQALGKFRMKGRLFIYDRMARLAKHLLRTNSTIIIDATFPHHQERELFDQLSLNLAVEIKWILVTASEAIMNERFAVQEQSKSKYTAPILVSGDFEPFAEHPLQVVSTNENIEEMINSVEQFIGAVAH